MTLKEMGPVWLKIHSFVHSFIAQTHSEDLVYVTSELLREASRPVNLFFFPACAGRRDRPGGQHPARLLRPLHRGVRQVVHQADEPQAAGEKPRQHEVPVQAHLQPGPPPQRLQEARRRLGVQQHLQAVQVCHLFLFFNIFCTVFCQLCDSVR